MNVRRLLILSVGISVCSLIFVATGCKPEKGEAGLEKIKPKIAIMAHPFSLKNVRLLEGPFKEAMERDRTYLHELEPDRLLHNFRVNAGLPSTAQPLGGWEEPKCELRGHFVGHFLSACALMSAAAGDEELRAKAGGIVAELAKCQDALGKSGYLSAYPEEFIDRVIAGKRVWAPWYTLHKIMTGLLDMYTYCGNRQALDVLEKMAFWAKMRSDNLDDEAMQRMLKTEFGGMSEVLANLYAVTANPDHLGLARRFDHKAVLDPLANRRDELKGLHANTQIPKIIGAAREYELTGDKYYYEIAAYFWDEVVNRRSYCTGGTSNYEGWQSDPGQMAGELSNATHETCCTYNMLKLTRELFTWNPDAKLADYYERALFNGILSTQDPATGMTMYYVPMASGWYKTFCTPRDSFWCCTGTGIENHAKYGDSIYFHDDTGILVNLFIASELKWLEKGVSLRQETRFPEEGETTFTLNCAQDTNLELRIRVPYWATNGVSVKVNGEAQEVSADPGSYLILARTWKDGDKVSVEMPLSLHLCRMPDDPKLAAVMFGPLVLAGELPAEELPSDAVYGPYHAEGKPAQAPDFVAGTDDLAAWIQPLPGRPLTFKTVDAGRPSDITLIPFYRLFAERYGLYWRFHTETEWKDFEAKRKARQAEEGAKQKALLERTVDSVEIADEKSEREHNLQSARSEFGYHLQRSWRHATRGGWFSYDVKVLPDKPMALMCTYWGSDVGRTFDILIDGTKIATQVVNVPRPGDFFDVEYKIPAELTRGKNKVTVKFQSYPDGIAGGLFGLVMLK
jgi:hypothetical protein